MCLVGLRIPHEPGEPLLIAANRDEFHARPTARAAFWADAPTVLGGRDTQASGTWLGVNTRGRWALVTNHRAPDEARAGARSRGALVADYLRGDHSPEAYAERALASADEFAAFNLVVGHGNRAWYVSSRLGAVQAIAPGVHLLSNAELDAPWPKAERVRAVIERGELDDVSLFEALRDETRPDDTALPDTGVGITLERMLGSVFIATPTYGTRSSTLVRMADHRIDFTERTFDPTGREVATTWYAVPRKDDDAPT